MAKGKNSEPGPMTEALAGIIRERMGYLGTNKTRLAEVSKIARTTLGNIIDGKAVYDIEQLDRVCQALDIEIEDVLEKASKLTEGRIIDSGIRPILRK